jgi:hypothetical protein
MPRSTRRTNPSFGNAVVNAILISTPLCYVFLCPHTFALLGVPVKRENRYREKALTFVAAKVQLFYDIHKSVCHFSKIFAIFPIFPICSFSSFGLGHRRFRPSLSSLCAMTVRPLRPSINRRPARFGLNAGVAGCLPVVLFLFMVISGSFVY